MRGIATAAHSLWRLSGEEDPDHSEEEVVPGDTSVGSAAVALAEFNRLRREGVYPAFRHRRGRSSHRLLRLGYGSLGSVQIPEVLAEPAPCKTPVRSTRIRGAITKAKGACGVYHARGAFAWEGKSWCWARHRRLGNGNRAGSFGRRGL